MALGELGGKPVQIPNMGGTPAEALKSLLAKRSKAEGTMFSASEDAERWAPKQRAKHPRHSRIPRQGRRHSHRTNATRCVWTSLCARCLGANREGRCCEGCAQRVRPLTLRLKPSSTTPPSTTTTMTITHHEPTPPVALENDAVSRPFELSVGLVGRPTYGTFDPTFFLMLTFPVIYGLILGDFGYGLIIFLLGFGLEPNPSPPIPLPRTASPSSSGWAFGA